VSVAYRGRPRADTHLLRELAAYQAFDFEFLQACIDGFWAVVDPGLGET
jgi:hypothetical protein